MLFEWDDKKRALNIAKHTIDFTDAQEIFDGKARFDLPLHVTRKCGSQA